MLFKFIKQSLFFFFFVMLCFFNILNIGLVSISMLSSFELSLGWCAPDYNTCTIGHSSGCSVSFAEEQLMTKSHHSAGLTAANSSHFHCLDKLEAMAHVSRMEGNSGTGGERRGVVLLRGDLD